MSRPERFEDCDYYQRNEGNDSRITDFIGIRCCAMPQGNCPYELDNSDFQRIKIGKVEGDNPILYVCPIADGIGDDNSGLVREVENSLQPA